MSPDSRSRADSPASRLRAWAAGWRGHWPVLLVFVAFAVAAIVVPTLAPVATTDDWGYARSAQILVQEQRLVVFPVVAATAVFQVVWGALFGWLFGPALGVFRLSTVVMVALGAVALYGLCRELGIDRHRSALGTAAYLFNPLLFVLAFTFMTDPHFVSLLVIATWAYARGLRPDAVSPIWVIAGSAAAGLALLTRQQGVLIPIAVVVYLLIARRLQFDRRGVMLFLQVVALPLVIFAGYFLWLRFGNDVPDVQTDFLRELIDEGWAGTWWLARRLTVVELVYLGFFTLPIVVAALAAGRGLLRHISRRGWLLFQVWYTVLLIGVTALWQRGMKMPYIGQFLGTSGPGAPDVLGSRPRLLTADMVTIITIVCVVASIFLALIAVRAIGVAVSPERATAGLVLAIALWQVAGIFPPSYHYIGWTAGSLDRYLLPLIPLAICLTLWALRDRPLFAPAGWVIVALFAIFATAGTRDYLVYMKSVWGMAYDAIEAGVPLDQLDAGAAWDGYWLYEYSLANLDRGRTRRGGPWWVYFYGRATDSSYVIASERQRGYFAVWQREYSTWLNPEPAYLYLQRRPLRPWPPTGWGSILDAESMPVRPAAPELQGAESGHATPIGIPSINRYPPFRGTPTDPRRSEDTPR
jgi:4-amino-4-deoxy-L-arabinose transferase-like glycosyltransferase